MRSLAVAEMSVLLSVAIDAAMLARLENELQQSLGGEPQWSYEVNDCRIIRAEGGRALTSYYEIMKHKD